MPILPLPDRQALALPRRPCPPAKGMRFKGACRYRLPPAQHVRAEYLLLAALGRSKADLGPASGNASIRFNRRPNARRPVTLRQDQGCLVVLPEGPVDKYRCARDGRYVSIESAMPGGDRDSGQGCACPLRRDADRMESRATCAGAGAGHALPVRWQWQRRPDSGMVLFAKIRRRLVFNGSFRHRAPLGSILGKSPLLKARL